MSTAPLAPRAPSKTQDSRQELESSLLATQATISPKYFYDELGSSLFTSICRLQEYYPTRTEAAILTTQGSAMAQKIRSTLGPIESLIDLGAGDCQKAAARFGDFQPRRYFAVDVSENFVTDAVRKLAAEFTEIEMLALARDLSQDWALPSSCPQRGRLFFYPGSSIGNFSPELAVEFLKRLRQADRESCSLLIGVDLVKPTEILEPAYDDALGITGAFNLNALNHVNRIINADFDVRDWRHVAFFNRQASRIEMHLEARRTVDVAWPSGARCFVAGERIQTEYSYKYDIDQFKTLLTQAGFSTEHVWSDDKRWFGVFLATSTL
jgi:dimethylhistidine N-methyltransferase